MGNTAGKGSSKKRSNEYCVVNSECLPKKNQSLKPYKEKIATGKTQPSEDAVTYNKDAKQLAQKPDLLTFDYLSAASTGGFHEAQDIGKDVATGNDFDRRSSESCLDDIDEDEGIALNKTVHFQTARKRANSLSENLQALSQLCLRKEEKALSQRLLSTSDSKELTSSNDNGRTELDMLVPITTQIAKQASRYLKLRENYSVLHLLVHGSRENTLRREQYKSYATVHPLINTIDAESEDSNAVMVEVEGKKDLFFILEHFIKISVRRNKHLETLYIVFNSHGHSDGTLELSDGKPGVHMNDIIKFLHMCRAGQAAEDVSNPVELHVVFGQCYAHSFDLRFAAQCDKITDIWWFTSAENPKTLNLRSEMNRLEHSELMRFARNPLRQNSLQWIRKQLELDDLKAVGQQLRNSFDQLAIQSPESMLPRYAVTFLHPGHLLLISNSQCQFHNDLPQNRIDAASLKDTFTRHLNYSFTLHENVTGQKIKRELKQLATDVDKESYFCFVVVILSHGCSGGVLGTDGECVSENFIIQTLGRSRFLEGKPKLILIQNCRFGETGKMDATPTLDTGLSDSGVPTQTQDIEDDNAFVGLDMVIARATTSGTMIRDSTQGSANFIQAFARHATQFAWSCDVNTILKMVTQDIVSNSSLRDLWCIPSISYNTLRKHFYLA